jgi:hypothetical protein
MLLAIFFPLLAIDLRITATGGESCFFSYDLTDFGYFFSASGYG